MYDALILVNGEIPSQALWQTLPYRQLICTDGAANFLGSSSPTPNIIIGDMDSISVSPQSATLEPLKLRFPHSTIVSDQDQSTTDFEKALLFSQNNQLNRLLCTGILGKLADHSVYNLSLLVRFGETMEILALSPAEEGTQWIFPLRAYTRIESLPHQTCSFLAFPEATLSTKGFQWELNQSTLTQSKQHSVRNQTLEKNTEIFCQGHCLAFLTAPKLPLIHYSKAGIHT